MKDTFVDWIGHDRQVMFQKYRSDEEGIALLLKLMETEPLNPQLENMLGHAPRWMHPDSQNAKNREGVKRYAGNFHRVSCVFSIDTRDPEMIARFDAAIEKNLASPEYLAAKEEWQRQQRRTEGRGGLRR
jgi:hypothetical protein